MMTVDEYRAAILDAMLQLKDNEGNARITEADAKDILKGFTDDELNDGILFNTPEEVAELLAEGVLWKDGQPSACHLPSRALTVFVSFCYLTVKLIEFLSVYFTLKLI